MKEKNLLFESQEDNHNKTFKNIKVKTYVENTKSLHFYVIIKVFIFSYTYIYLEI